MITITKIRKDKKKLYGLEALDAVKEAFKEAGIKAKIVWN